MLEKWIYKRSDKIIMTWAGGFEYICEKGWEQQIPAHKVACISNGVDLEEFVFNKENNVYSDPLMKDARKKFVYAGSIRRVNNLGLIVDAARLINSKDVLFIIFGDGDERSLLEQQVQEFGLDNVVFKGKVEKKYIPSILNQSYCSILHNKSTQLDKYGQSQNKFFEYLAAGKPILMTYSVGHSIVNKYECGIELQEQTAYQIAEAVDNLSKMQDEAISFFNQHAYAVAKDYDFDVLTRKLIDIIEE